MANNVIKQNEAVLWVQEDGPGTAFRVIGVGDLNAGMTGKNIPGISTTPVYSRDRNGRPQLVATIEEAPGDLPTATITIYERGVVDFLLRQMERRCPINIQNRFVKCGTLDRPNAHDALEAWPRGTLNVYNPGDGPTVEYAGVQMTAAGTLNFEQYFRVLRTGLSALAVAEEEDILSIGGLTEIDCGDCGSGYPGADKIMYVGAAAADGTSAGNVYYTVNGGSTWNLLDGLPFGNGEDVSFIRTFMLDNDQHRVVAGTATPDAAAPAKIAYIDVAYGDEGGTHVWTAVPVTLAADNTAIQAMEPLFFDRLYVATDGDIYISTDQGDSLDDAPIYSSTPAINAFAKSPDEVEVWAVGASNSILLEQNQNGVFAVRVGPSGGGAFTAVAQAADGRLYAGNGTSLYVSVNHAKNAGGWHLLKNFGTDRAVRKIQVIGHDSNYLRVVVDHTGGVSEVWESIDGGFSFTQVPELTNTGYNDAYFSWVDRNLAVIVGDASAGAGVIQLLSQEA
jgi:hypothetical protein